MATYSTPSFFFRRVAVILILLAGTFAGKAQDFVNPPAASLPKVFSNLSDSIRMDINVLTALFSKKNNEKVTIALGNEMLLEGSLHTVTTNYNNTLTATSIKLALPYASVFTFSRIMIDSNTIVYRGLVIGKNMGDYLELVQDKNEFIFVKKDIRYLLAE